jgi:TatD DNase family protein
MMYVDCHTHLTNSTSADDIRVHESIRIYSLAVGTDEMQVLSNSDKNLTLHQTTSKPYRYFSIGLHPMIVPNDILNQAELTSFVNTVDSYISKLGELISRLRSESPSYRIVAIGEIGFDTRSVLPMEYQRILFDKQVALAESFSLPIVIHCVKAFDELLSAHSAHNKRTSSPKAWVVHGYVKSQELAQTLCSRGMYLSFGSAVLKAESGLSNMLTTIPSSRLLLETDMYSGTIDEIYNHTATHRNISLEELKKVVYDNATKVFDIE